MEEMCEWFVWALSWPTLESEGGYPWPYRISNNELIVCINTYNDGENAAICFYDLDNVRELYEKYAPGLTSVFDGEEQAPKLSWQDFWSEEENIVS